MDYFLLDDVANLRQYAAVHLFDRLNPLEKILMVFALDDDKLRQRTLRYFQNEQKLQKVSPQEMDKLFRTALAEKQLSSEFDKPVPVARPEPGGGYGRRRGSPVEFTSFSEESDECSADDSDDDDSCEESEEDDSSR